MGQRTWKAGAVVVLLASAVLVGRSLLAFSSGISGYSGDPATGGLTCNECHSGGVAPVVTISGPKKVVPGATETYLLHILQPDPPNNAGGGLDVSTSDGALSVSDPGTQLLGGEVTHNAPRAMTAGEVSWTFNWTAPLTPGSATLYGAGNAVSLSVGNNRDLASTGTLVIQVAEAGGTPGEASGPALSPLLVTTIDQMTGDMTIAYDAACETTSNNIYYGPLSLVSSHGWTGEVCNIGTGGTHAGFNPGSDSYFFVVVGTKASDEGSYGESLDPTPAERPPFVRNTCGQTQNLANACD